ncbi:MAG: cyanophycin synthetase [Myxococcota bacterium]
MEFLKILTLGGPNIWSRHPMLEAWVDLQELKDSPSNSIPGFTDRLMGWLPTLIEHRCSIGERGGFLHRLREGTWPAHILEHVTLELQSLAGTPVGFGKARETSKEGTYKVAVRYKNERVGKAAMMVAHELVLAAAYDRPFDIEGEIKKLKELVDKYCLGPSSMAIVNAAEARNIPARRLNERSLVQLGQGKKARRIWTAETDRTSAIAGFIAQDKQLTKQLLRAAGVPVPEGRAVDSAEDAWDAAQSIGVPVVVKPTDANHGRGVFTGLRTEAQVTRAYKLAQIEGSGVLVETFAPGAEHRLLIVGDKLVAATRGEAAFIVGDGVRTVEKLIHDQINSDPRRGEDENAPLCYVYMDPIVLLQLEQQGHTPASIPGPGEQILVQRNDNLAIDVTDEVHPTVAAHAVLATKIVGLDIAGLDIVAEDIARPLEDQGGVVVEVNAGPGLLMHLKPSVGTPRPVGEAIVAQIYAPNDDGRVPIACVTGTNGKTIVTKLLAHLLAGTERVVGLTSSDGVVVGDRLIESIDAAGPISAQNVLMHPDVEAAVFEAGRGGILREGLGFDKCDVAIVTNIAEADHLGQSDINTPEQMFMVKRSAVDVVLPGGAKVLKADDPKVAEMAGLGRGEAIFFAIDGEHPLITARRAEGGKSAYVREGAVTIGEGPFETTVLPLEEIPLTHGGRAQFQVENVLAAVAAATALKVPLDILRERLASFADVPGRFNVHAHRGGTLILDDAHNIPALRALVTAIADFPASRRTVVYSAGPGRRDEDLIEQGKMLGAAFDRVILYADPRMLDRPVERLFALFQQGLLGAPRSKEIIEIPNASEARRAGLAGLEPGALVVLQAEDQNPGPALRDLTELLNIPPPGPVRSETVGAAPDQPR